jgi:hypothetical protein
MRCVGQWPAFRRHAAVNRKWYWQAWAGVMGGDARYQEFAERWGSSGFGTYVDSLRAQADRALQSASDVSLCCTAATASGFDTDLSL